MYDTQEDITHAFLGLGVLLRREVLCVTLKHQGFCSLTLSSV